MSSGAPSEWSGAPSSARLGQRRARLRRSGAIHSSRSALSRHEVPFDDDIVGVGAGRHANVFESLLARLEQHGLRRCLCAEEEGEVQAVMASVLAAETATASCAGATHSDLQPVTDDVEDDLVRAPYYYLCVPCELRLTSVKTRAASAEMLADVHDHFASAAHRRLARWMADADIDVTLRTSPLVAQPAGYARAHVNGVPVLLSRRPGGGDLFYALPHEEAHVVGEQHDAQAERTASGHTSGQLLPPRGAGVYWYHPLRSMFTQCKQHPTTKRRALAVRHIPLQTYLDQTRLPRERVPVWPVLLPLRKRRRRKDDLPSARTMTTIRADGCRVVYEQGLQSALAVHGAAPLLDRCLVEPEAAYRVALVSSAQLRDGVVRAASSTTAAVRVESEAAAAAVSVPLTRALLSQVTDGRRRATCSSATSESYTAPSRTDSRTSG